MKKNYAYTNRKLLPVRGIDVDYEDVMRMCIFARDIHQIKKMVRWLELFQRKASKLNNHGLYVS